jgi:protein required for attachment to host cells
MNTARSVDGYGIGLVTTWILVAHRSGAKLFESRGRGWAGVRKLSTVLEISHPTGRLKPRELMADRPGRAFSSSNLERHSHGSPQEPRDRVASDFARRLCAMIESGRVHGRFDRLVLVAGPSMLGKLRESLSRPTAEILVASVAKDLPLAGEEDLLSHLPQL